MKTKILIIATILVAGLILFRLPLDSDLGWHIKDGQKIVQQGWQPIGDTYTHTMANYPWRSHAWGFDVVAYWLSSSSNFLLLSILFAILPLASLLLSLKRTRVKLLPELWTISLLFAAALVFLPLGVRSQTLTFFYSGVLLYLLQRWQQSGNNKLLFALPLLLWIWVNSHGGFIMGLGIIGLYLIAEFIKRMRLQVEGEASFAKEKDTLTLPQLKFGFIALFASILVTFLNPYGPGIYQTALSLSASTPTSQYILEWQALDVHSAYGAFFAMYAALLFFFIYRDRRTLDLKDALFTAVFLALMFWAIRNAPLFVLITIPLFAQGLQETIQTQFREFVKKNPVQSILMLSLIVVLVVISVLNPKIQSDNSNNIDNQNETTVTTQVSLKEVFTSPEAQGRRAGFPVDAFNWIKANHPQGNMFNAYVWGGYLVWQLPEYKVFIDGRMPAWEKDDTSILKEYLDAEAAKPSWKETFEKYNVQWVLLSPDAPIFQVLKLKPNWHEVYRDDLAVIMRKDGQ